MDPVFLQQEMHTDYILEFLVDLSECGLEFLLTSYAEWDLLTVKIESYLLIITAREILMWFKLLGCTPFYIYTI